MDRLMLAAVLVWTVALSLLLPVAARAADLPLDDDDSGLFAPIAPAASIVAPPTTPSGLRAPATPAPLVAPVRPGPAVPLSFGGRALSELPDHGTKVIGTEDVTLDDRYDDVFVMGNSVVMTGYIEDHLFAAVADLTVDGHVVQDVFVAAGEVVINGSVGGDLYVSAGELLVAEGAHIGGKILGGVGKLIVDGQVDGDLQAGAGEMIVRGTVGGDIDAEVGRLVLEDGAVVGGRLSYVSGQVATVSDRATVGGELSFEQSTPRVANDNDGPAIAAFLRSWGAGASMLLGALLLWLGGPIVRRAMDTARDETAHRLGLGFAVTLVVPALAGFMGLFILPLPVSFLLMVLLGVGLWFGRVIAAGALGSFLLTRAGQENPDPYLSLFVGLLVLFLLAMVPVLGFLLGAAATMVGLGALYATAREVRAAAG